MRNYAENKTMSQGLTVGQTRDISVSALPNVIDSDENLVTQTSLLSQTQCMGYGQSSSMSHATASGTQSKLTNVAKTTTASASISSNSLEMPYHTREPINVMDRHAEQSQRISPTWIPPVSNPQMWADCTQHSVAGQRQMANNNPPTQSCTVNTTLHSQTPSVSASETQTQQPNLATAANSTNAVASESQLKTTQPVMPTIVINTPQTVRPYKGNTSWSSFRDNFNRIAMVNGWNTVSNVLHIDIYSSDTRKYSMYITPYMSMLNCTVVWFHRMVR